MTILFQSLLFTLPAILRTLPMLATALALWVGGAYLAAMNVRFVPFFTMMMLGTAHCSLLVARGALIFKGGAGPLRRGRLADAADFGPAAGLGLHRRRDGLSGPAGTRSQASARPNGR